MAVGKVAAAKRTKKHKEQPKQGVYSTPALEKGLDVLELLAGEPTGLAKSEIASRLGKTMSMVFRMLVCLEDRGYLARRDGDRYTLSLKLFKLVQQHPPTERLMSEALPFMHQLTHQILQSCHLGVIEGADVVFLAQVNAPTSAGFYVKPGTSIDMMKSGSGYVILAHQTIAHQRRALEEWQKISGESLPRDLQKHLAKVKQLGYEQRESYEIEGILNLSFPIFNSERTAVAALTCPYIRRRHATMSLHDVIESIRRSAADVTAAIGGAGPSAKLDSRHGRNTS